MFSCAEHMYDIRNPAEPTSKAVAYIKIKYRKFFDFICQFAILKLFILVCLIGGSFQSKR